MGERGRNMANGNQMRGLLQPLLLLAAQLLRLPAIGNVGEGYEAYVTAVDPAQRTSVVQIPPLASRIMDFAAASVIVRRRLQLCFDLPRAGKRLCRAECISAAVVQIQEFAAVRVN